METFIVIEFSDITLNYPNDMPVPNKGDFIRMDLNHGFIKQIFYTIEKNCRKIRLIAG